ncbi:MAG: Txe/YoeB family addiction module toxin [Muribaculaceae bacterium]|nr:Txe/YoeB family addiction module toxin [Muribaculaceae bacterium]
MYEIIISPKAIVHLRRLQSNEPTAYEKAVVLIEELKVHPRTGTGHPEPLKGGVNWSRRISKKHRLVYSIHDEKIHIDILSAWGHYDDK